MLDTSKLSIALLSIPLITALIGWFTNFIAIKMLFHPRQPVVILGFTLQGILPRRQPDIAIQLGKIVANDLLSSDDLANQLTNENSQQIYNNFIDSQSERFIREKLRRIEPVAGLLLKSQTLNKLKAAFAEELVSQLPGLVEKLTHPDENALDIQEIVEDRIRNFSTDRMERILYDILAKEFRFIEWLGAVLGFIIGLVQLVILLV